MSTGIGAVAEGAHHVRRAQDLVRLTKLACPIQGVGQTLALGIVANVGPQYVPRLGVLVGIDERQSQVQPRVRDPLVIWVILDELPKRIGRDVPDERVVTGLGEAGRGR